MIYLFSFLLCAINFDVVSAVEEIRVEHLEEKVRDHPVVYLPLYMQHLILELLCVFPSMYTLTCR